MCPDLLTEDLGRNSERGGKRIGKISVKRYGT
jgi:hypothetical protein